MRRKLFTLAAAGSAVLFVAVVAMWVRSYGRVDLARWTGASRGWYVWSSAGVVVVNVFAPAWGDEPVSRRWSVDSDRHGGDYYTLTPWDRLGFGWKQDDAAVLDGTRAYVPYWFLALAAGAVPAARLVGAMRSRRRPAPGRCPGCFYDLMGNISGVCPECGQPAPKGFV